MPKIYVFCNQGGCDGSGDWHSMVALAEDGTGLAGHICSHHGWAMHDMGIDEDGWKRDLYAKHYPEGFEVVWVDKPESHAEVQRIIASAVERAEAAINAARAQEEKA